MNGNLFILLMIITPGVIASGVISVLSREKIMAKGGIGAACEILLHTVFAVLCFAFVSSLVKSLTGKGTISYMESLEYMAGSTFTHYAIIDAVLLVCMLAAFLLLKADKWFNLYRTLMMWLIVLFIVLFAFYGQLPNNRLFAAEFAIGAVAAIVEAILCSGKRKSHELEKKAHELEKKTHELEQKADELPGHDGDTGDFAESNCDINVKDLLVNGLMRIKEAAPAFILWFIVNYIYMPGELFLSNVGDIRLMYRSFFISCLLIGLAITLSLMAVAVIVLPDRFLKYVNIGVFAVSLMSYLQHMFLNGHLRSMDGAGQQWGTMQIVINIAIWLLAGTALYALGIIKDKACRIYRIAALCISALLIFTVGFLAFTTHQDTSDTLTCEGTLSISNKDNVIVFVLDWYDAQYADKIMEEDSDFYNELSDFTYYDNATSLYSCTGESLPYMLTGIKWVSGVDVANYDYVDYAFARSTWLSDIKNKGYSVGVYTDPNMMSESQSDVLMNYSSSPEQNYSMTECAALSLRTSKYLGMPFLYKNRYTFNTYDYMNLLHDDDGWVTNDDYVFYSSLINEGLKANDGAAGGAFRFYHLYGVHSPYRLTEDVTPVYDNNADVDGCASLRV